VPHFQSMSRAFRNAAPYLAGIFYKTAAMLGSFLLVLALSSRMTPHDFGVYSIGFSAATLTVPIADFGQRTLIIRFWPVLNGWLNYYAVPGSSRALSAFVFQVKRLLLLALRRRSQKDRTDWPTLGRKTRSWPRPTIRHPWPNQRLAVTTRGRSRMR